MYCGTSNIVLPVPNKSFFPEAYRDKTRLQYYASLFNSLEVNQTFYKVPRANTLSRWASEVPDHFRFSVKMWKGITHAKALQFEEKDVVHFMQTVSAFGHTKGCLLIQFPAGTRSDMSERLLQLLELVNYHNDGWQVAVEFRHASWYTRGIYRCLQHHHAAMVIHDMPGSITPAAVPDADVSYFRFHGVEGDYKGSYSKTDLEAHTARMRKMESSGKTVYAYFNNTLGDAVHNALSLQQLMMPAHV